MLSWSNFRASGASVGKALVASLALGAAAGVAGRGDALALAAGAGIAGAGCTLALATGATGAGGALVLVTGTTRGGDALILVAGVAGAGGALLRATAAGWTRVATAAGWTGVAASLPLSADLRLTASTNAFVCAINASRSSIHFMTPPQPRIVQQSGIVGSSDTPVGSGDNSEFSSGGDKIVTKSGLAARKWV